MKEIDGSHVFHKVLLGENNAPVIREHEYVFQREWYNLIAFDFGSINNHTEILLPKNTKIIELME